MRPQKLPIPNFSVQNCLKNNKTCYKSIVLTMFFLLSYILNSKVIAQNLITTPSTLQNFQTDNSVDKRISLAVSEDGNVVVKGSPFSNNGNGSVTLYFRDNNGIWSNSLLQNPTDATDNARVGFSVAISADASTIVIGGNNDSGGVGAVWIYKRNGISNSYSQFGNKILPSDYNGKSSIGTSVAISGDGSTIIFGAPNDGLDVSIFESLDGSITLPIVNIKLNLPIPGKPIWITSFLVDRLYDKLDKIPEPVYTFYSRPYKFIVDQFFYSNDFRKQEFYRNNVGAAWVFKYNPTTNSYYQDGDKMQNKGKDGLFGSNLNASLNFGPAASLVPGQAQSALDSIIKMQREIVDKANEIVDYMRPFESGVSWLVGPLLPKKIPNYVFTRDVSNITPDASSPYYNELMNLKNATNSRLFENALQGTSVSISKDGKTVMMGAPGLLNGKGVSYFYRNDSTASGKSWVGEDVLAGDNTSSISPISFGNNLAISPDGLLAVIGSPLSLRGTDTTGAVQVFEKNTTTKRWSKAGNNIVPSNATIGTNKKLGLGTGFTFSSDNNDLIIGAPFDNNGRGALWLYKPVNGSWTNQQKITPPSGLTNGNFGSSLAIGEYGLTLVAGAHNTSSGGNAYVYNSCEPPKPILAQYADTICSDYHFNKYYQYNKRLNASTGWVWRVGSENGPIFSPGVGESASNDSLIKKTLSTNTTYFVRGEGGCANGKSVSITTVVKPTPARITNITSNYVCNGGQITLNATSSSGQTQWIGSTWDGLRFGYTDPVEGAANYTAPYGYYTRNLDPKQPAYNNGPVLAKGNTYKPSINSSRNFYVASMLNGCWSDTSSVNARIERVVDISLGDNNNTSTVDACDSVLGFHLGNFSQVPFTIYAPEFNNYRGLQMANSIIPTQLPFKYKYFQDSAGFKFLDSSLVNQKTVDMGPYYIWPNREQTRLGLFKNYFYSITNACGESSLYSIKVTRNPGPAISHNFIKADTPKICPNTFAIFNLENTISSYDHNYSFKVYDASTGNNLVATVNPRGEEYYDYSLSKYLYRVVGKFTTPYLTASRNYYVTIVSDECGESLTRVPIHVKVDPLTPPQIYNITVPSVCDSGQVLLSALANDGGVLWYDNPSSNATPLTPNTLLYDGQYLTPKLTHSTTYWVGSTGQKCFGSPKIAVPVPIYETPVLTVSQTSYTTCVPGTDFYLTASASIGAVYWYASPTSQDVLWTQPTFRVSPSVTTTYYVEASTSSNCKSARVPVTVYVNQPPRITSVTPGSRVNSGTVNLSAIANYGTVNWTATDGSLLFQGNNYTTWSINSTTTYYVSASTSNTGCTSERIPVVATVNYVPIVNTTKNASRCGAGSVTLSASAEVGTIRWYDANNNQVGTGNTFTTPSLNTTTTYYAQSWYLNNNNSYDASPAIPVKAYIYSINAQTINYSGGCVGQQPRVNISPLQAGVRYSLRTGTTVLDSKFANGANNKFDLIAPAITNATTYNIFAEKYDSSTALRFNGNNDYIEIPYSHQFFDLNSGNFLLGAWIKRDDIQKTHVIISKKNVSQNSGYELSISSDNKLTFDYGLQRVQTTATISTQWTHVAAQLSNTGVKLYINGVLSEIININLSGSSVLNSGNIFIGSSQQYKGDANYGFSGVIDDIAIFYDYGTTDKIATLMNGKLVGNEQGLIAYYNFEHGANFTNLIDECVEAGINNGVLKNMDSLNAWTTGPSLIYCSSQLSSSTLTPVSVPSIISSFGAQRVGAGSLTLTANSSVGSTTQWFADSTSTTPIATGNTYTIPLLNFTKQYYVAASNGCLSNKVMVLATINDIPDEQQINCINNPSDISLIDRTAGEGSGFVQVVRQGYNLFTVTGDGKIRVYTSASGSMSFVSSYTPATGSINKVFLANGYLYTVNRGSNQLNVIDISDLTNLKLVGVSNNTSWLNRPTDIVVNGLNAYIPSYDDRKLYITYIGQPTVNIYNASSVNLAGIPNIVQRKDNIIYVGIENVGIQLVDVSNMWAPFVTRTLNLTSFNINVYGVNQFYIKGNFLYVSINPSPATSSNPTILKVYDITNASNPVFVRDVTLTDGYAKSFAADSKYLYLGTTSPINGVKRIQVLDISNPSNPIVLVAPSAQPFPFEVEGLAVRLGHIYGVDYHFNDYTVPAAASITSTNPASRLGDGTANISATATGGTISWYTVATGGSPIATGATFTTPNLSSSTTYYVGANSGSCNSIRVPVTVTVNPIPLCIDSGANMNNNFINTLNSLQSTTSTQLTGNSQASILNGNILFTSNGTKISSYDLLSGSPVHLNTVNVMGYGYIQDMYLYNNKIYSVGSGQSSIGITDVSNPSAMTLIGGTSSNLNEPTAIVVEGSFAYVSNSLGQSLDVYDISNPSNLNRVAQVQNMGVLARGLKKKGNILFIANKTNGFSLVDVSNPYAPTLVNHINSKESGDVDGAYNFIIIDNYLYVSNYFTTTNATIRIYDISNPNAPAFIKSISSGNPVLSFSYDGLYLYCGLASITNADLSVYSIYNMRNLLSPSLYVKPNISQNSNIRSVYNIFTYNGGNNSNSSGNSGRIYMSVGDQYNYVQGYGYFIYNSVKSWSVSSTTPGSRCGTGSVTLQATASVGYSNKWYSDAAGKNLLFNGNTFNTPSISSTTTFYVAPNVGCQVAPIPVVATVYNMPQVTSTSGGTRRDTGTVTLQATANRGLLNWFATPTGGTSLGTGQTFTTPVINNTTTFYVEAQDENCPSVRIPVVATVITTPVIRTVTEGSRCLAGSVTLSATASIGTINWYESNSSNTILATGNSFTTPSLTSSRPYYVSTTHNGETSARVFVFANVGSLPANANIITANVNNFCGDSLNLSADSVNGSSGQWSVLSGIGQLTNAVNINTTLKNIGSSLQVIWTVRSQYCPDKVDTININVAKPKPILYAGNGNAICNQPAGAIVKYDANKDTITLASNYYYGTPDMNGVYGGGMTVSKNGKMYGVSETGGVNNRGTIFEFDPRTNIVKAIYSFSNTTGANPRPPLVETSPGVLWGTTGNGGANSRGVIYKFNVNTGQYTVVRNSPSTGDSYASGIAQKGSKLYFIARDASQLHEVDTATNAFLVKYTFPANYLSAAYYNFVIASDGNLYGLVPNGSNGYGELFQYNFTTNTHSIKFAPTNNSFGNGLSTYLTLASNNKFYWVGNDGGANNQGTIVEYDPATNLASKKFDFNSSQNVRGLSCVFTQASDGYLYAASSNGGVNNNGGIFRFSPATSVFEMVKYNNSCRSVSNILTEYITSDAYAGPDTTICGNTATLQALGASYGTGTWSVVKGSATFANVNNANTQVTVASDTTVLRWTISDGACYTSFDEVQLTRKPLPAITASGLQSCTAVNGNYTLTATSAGATINWYADSTGTQTIGTGNTYAIAASGGSAKIFVTATIDGCTSLRTPVVISLPTITSTTPGARCNAGTVRLAASANTGTINWFNTATGGTSIGTGNNFTTPVITGTTTFYAEASQNGCVSARVAVNATITGDFNTSVWPVVYSFSGLNGGQADVTQCLETSGTIYTTSLRDNNVNSGAVTTNYTGESWIQAKFATPSVVNSVTVSGGTLCTIGQSASYLNGSSLQYSNNGSSWTTHSTISGANDNTTTTINVGSITAQYWRLYKSGNNYVAAGEFSFSPMPTAISPLMANAGPDQTGCSSTFTVTGNTPNQGKGVWSVARGIATITNPTSPTTTVTGVKGTVILRWTFNSEDCGISFDEVMLTSNIKPVLWGVTDNFIYSYNSNNNTITSSLQNNSNTTLFKGSNNKLYLFTSSHPVWNTPAINEYLPNKSIVSPIRPFYGGGYFEDNGEIFATSSGNQNTYNINTGAPRSYININTALPGRNLVNSSEVLKIGNTLFGTAINQFTSRWIIYSFNLVTNQATERYIFPNSSSGGSPGAFILGTNGRLYGFSSTGGTNGGGYIYEFDTTSNSVTIRQNFASYNNMSGATALFLASNNRIYGTCTWGGANSGGGFWEYDYLNNSFTVRQHFNNTTSSGSRPGNGSRLMQASDGKIYGFTQEGGAFSRGMIYSYDINTNQLVFLQSLNLNSEASYQGRLVEFNDMIADAGPDQTICGTTATLAANTAFAGTGTWSVVAGTATITNVNSPTTTVTGLKGGPTILRWTISNGLCNAATTSDDVVINVQGITSVTDGRRCGTGAGTVTLSATASPGMTVNWYNQYTNAVPNTSISLNGSNKVSISSSNAIPTGNTNYTIELWVKPTILAGSSGLVGWGNWGSSHQVNSFRFNGSTELRNDWWGNDLSVSIPNVLDGNWHHVAVSYNGSTRSIYFDGVLRGSDNPGNGINVPYNSNFELGTYANTNFYNGSMDEIRIWNVARTASQIAASMNATVPSNSSGLVAYYMCDQGSGSNLANAVGNGNNGSFSASSSWSNSTPFSYLPVKGTLLGTGNSFTTPSISATTTYFAEAVGNGCTALTSTSVTAYVSPAVATPTITATGSTTICNGTSVVLNAHSSLVPFTKFASSLISFSSQYGTSSSELLGVNDQRIWYPATSSGTREFLVLGYTNPQPINSITIYEGGGGLAGGIDTVYVRNPNTGNWVIVYSGAAAAKPSGWVTNNITFPTTAFPVSEVRIALNNNAFNNWKSIDAVSINYSVNVARYTWLPNGETTTSINVLNAGSYSLQITDSSGCTATSAPTTVTLNTSGVVANAGADQVNCSGNFTMAANGTGTWSIVSGSATITSTSSATTAVTVNSSAATLRWTINSASCGTTTDDVVLTKTSSPPLLLYPNTDEPGCSTCGVGAYNLFDVAKVDILSKKALADNGVYYQDFLYKASDGTLYGIGTDASDVRLFYYDPLINKQIVIAGLRSTDEGSGSYNGLRNIFEYNGQLFVVARNGSNAGLFYRISLQTKKVVSNFGIPSNIPNYQYPSGGLTLSGGKIYGMTNSGIYEYNPTNDAFSWKYSFPSNFGNDFKGELISGGNGKLYGVSAAGGANNYGTLFEYDIASNSGIVRVNFSSSNGYNPRKTPIVTGNLLYGVFDDGGANNRGTLWEYNITTSSFTVKYNFTNLNQSPINQLMQASNGRLYGISGGPDGYGQLYSYDIISNTFLILKSYDQYTGRINRVHGPLVEEKFVAPTAGPSDVSLLTTCNNTITLSPGISMLNAGTSKWSVVSGEATIANPDSLNAIVNNLVGINTFRLTTNYGPCLSTFKEITYTGKPANPSVTNGSRCGTGAGSVTLAATTTSPTGVINWYAAATGGSSLGTGNTFTTPSINNTTTYYAEVADKYSSRNVTYSVSNIYDQCNFNNSALNDNNFSTGVVVNGHPAFIKASFDSAYTINNIYLAAGVLCNNATTGGYHNYYGPPTIYYSNDNVNWTYVLTATGMTDFNGKQAYNVGGITARYWRLQNPNNPSWPVAVTEFSFEFLTNFSCTSNRVPVTAFINSTGAPTITSVTNGSGCNSATLQASASAGTINWYASSIGGSVLDTGNSFTTPTLSANTTYFVSAINNGCESPRTAVTATINAPSITCAANVVVDNSYNQCGATVTVPIPTVSSPCGGATPTLTNSYNNTANASGYYPKGTTTIVWTATGANGNTSTCTQTVTVNDNQSPNTVCQNRTIYLDANGVATLAASQINNGSTDNCGIASLQASKTTFDCSNRGANQVILTVLDSSGNDAACASTVTVLDTIKPIVIVPANITVNNVSSQCRAVVTFAATATDNCTVSSITYSPASGSQFLVGTTIVTATATDASGNSSSATFTVTVVDNQNPVIVCPANITVSCSASTDSSNTGRATATDNCGIQSITFTDVSTKSTNNTQCSFYNYTITRTWTATDVNGRTSNCNQIITVVDVVSPIISANGAGLNLGCNPTNAQIEAALGTATATDNCSIVGTPTFTDGAVVVNGILRSQTRTFNVTDVCGNSATPVTRTATWTELAPASVNVSASSTSVCEGTTATFTATPFNGGANPTYQWLVNGNSISGATLSSFTYSPANGDVVRCALTATNACQTNVTANSNSITMFTKLITTSSTSVTICSSDLPYLWNGNSYTATGSYNYTTLNAEGCDSIATLVLTVNPITTSYHTINICPAALPFSWNGSAYSAAGVYDKHFVNANGCDSIATLNLTVQPISSSTEIKNICNAQLPYIWNGTPYSVSGTYSLNFTSASGCDSVATLILTVNQATLSVTRDSIDYGGSYVWNGNTYTTAGTYTLFLVNSAGCDSSANLILTFKVVSRGGNITGVMRSCKFNTPNRIYAPVPLGTWSTSDTNIAVVDRLSNVIAKANGSVIIYYVYTLNGIMYASTADYVVAVVPTPEPIIGNNQVCIGASTTLSCNTPNGVWSGNSRVSINSAGVVTGINAGSVNIAYTVSNIQGCSSSSNLAFNVNALPAVPNIAYGPGGSNPQSGAPAGSFCRNKSFNLLGFPVGGVWTSFGTISVNSNGNATTGNTNGFGSVTYTVTNSNGCSNRRTMTGNVVACASRGAESETQKANFIVYPNPAKTIVNIKVDNLVGKGEIILTDLLGKQIKQQLLSLGNNSINVSHLAKGMYLINIITEQGREVKKVVVE